MVQEYKIILDTNFLLTMVRYKIHGLAGIKENVPAKFFVLSGTIDELVGLSKSNKKIKKEFILVEKMLEVNKVEGIKSQMSSVDDELVKKSDEFIIATNDKELRKKIKAFGGKSIYVKKLAFVDLSEITS